MRSPFPLFSVLMASLVILWPSGSARAQQPHWYMLLEPGNERWYVGADGRNFHEIVTGYQDGYSVVHQQHFLDGILVEETDQFWLIDETGDVWMGPNCYLDMPLEVGKSWGRTWGEYDQYYDWFQIIGRESTYAPDCFVIRESIDDGSGSVIMIVRWYSDGIGLVHWEVSCAYCSYTLVPVTVSSESLSWGSLKTRYLGN